VGDCGLQFRFTIWLYFLNQLVVITRWCSGFVGLMIGGGLGGFG
jgi:hypothetical protein